jgi:FixJ family two-component response regulator
MGMATQPKVVMVVDDDASILKSLARLLTAYGFVAQTFPSAEALLAKGGTCGATCLILDIHLGGISGIELNRRLTAAGSTCPIIFMTATDDDMTRQEALEVGCIAYLRKPFGPNLLLEAIEKAAA